MLGRRRRPL